VEEQENALKEYYSVIEEAPFMTEALIPLLGDM
jgi:hypothetical protein